MLKGKGKKLENEIADRNFIFLNNFPENLSKIPWVIRDSTLLSYILFKIHFLISFESNFFNGKVTFNNALKYPANFVDNLIQAYIKSEFIIHISLPKNSIIPR